MPYQRIALLCLAIWLWPVSGKGRTVEETAIELATETLDSLRDKTHRERMKIVWPLKTAAVAAPPPGAEVYLIRGYIDYQCTRLTWRDGKLRAERIRAGRTWFYNPKGESYEAQRFEIPAADFLRAWHAASLRLEAEAEPVQPPQPQESLEETLGHGHIAMMSSSHQTTCG